MANPTIKSTAIVRAGYEFQDLVGIEALIRFYREPHLFDWVMLEADEDAYGFLDDVIAARSDGTFEFTQVKFATSSATVTNGVAPKVCPYVRHLWPKVPN